MAWRSTMDNIINLLLNINTDLYLDYMIRVGLGVFIVTLIYYLYLIFQIKRFRNLLIKVAKEEEVVQSRIHLINNRLTKSKLISKFIMNPWKKFYNDYTFKKSEHIPDPLFYYSEKELVYKTGYRKIVESIPAIFVSLGILGTFLGLIIGLEDIDSTANVEGLQTGINTLLSGMGFAFYSSIAGILMSIIYQIIDRLFFYRLITNTAHKLLNTIDSVLPIETESSLLEQMVKTQEAQLNGMKEFL